MQYTNTTIIAEVPVRHPTLLRWTRPYPELRLEVLRQRENALGGEDCGSSEC